MRAYITELGAHPSLYLWMFIKLRPSSYYHFFFGIILPHITLVFAFIPYVSIALNSTSLQTQLHFQVTTIFIGTRPSKSKLIGNRFPSMKASCEKKKQSDRSICIIVKRYLYEYVIKFSELLLNLFPDCENLFPLKIYFQ